MTIKTHLYSTQHKNTTLFISAHDPILTEITDVFASAYEEENGVVLATKDVDDSLVNKLSQKLYHRDRGIWKLIFASNEASLAAIVKSAMEDVGRVMRLECIEA